MAGMDGLAQGLPTTGFGAADTNGQTLAAIQQMLTSMGIAGPRASAPGTPHGQGQDNRGSPMPSGGGGSSAQSSGGDGGGGGGGKGGAGSGFQGLIGKLGGMFGKNGPTAAPGSIPGAPSIPMAVPASTAPVTAPQAAATAPTNVSPNGAYPVFLQRSPGGTQPAVGGANTAPIGATTALPSFAMPGAAGINQTMPSSITNSPMGPFPAAADGHANANNVPVPLPPSQDTGWSQSGASNPAGNPTSPLQLHPGLVPDQLPTGIDQAPSGMDQVPGAFQGASLDPSLTGTPAGGLFGMFGGMMG